MGFLSGLFHSRDKPTNSTNGSAYRFLFGGSNSDKAVNERSAMQMTAVYACVRILSESIAGLPVHIYKYKYTDSGSKEKAIKHPLYRLIHDEPNPEMTSFVFRETLMTHLLLYGNAYAQIIRNGKGEVIALYPLMANRMSVDRDDKGHLYYQYQMQDSDAPYYEKWNSTLTFNGAAGSYGSTIKSYSISGGGYSGTSSTLTTGFLNGSGTITFTATVTDSRGRTSAAATVSITVVAYSVPSFSSYNSQRCNSGGTISDDGTYIRATVSYSFASCSSMNTVTRSTYYRVAGTSTWTNASTSFNSGTAFTFGSSKISTETSYEVKYELTGAFTIISITDIVSTASVVMDSTGTIVELNLLSGAALAGWNPPDWNAMRELLTS